MSLAIFNAKAFNQNFENNILYAMERRHQGFPKRNAHTVPNPMAVVVRKAVKQYGAHGPLVLKGFNMTVEQGTIYSLLGSSGCGKTTALTCILGIKRLNSGEVFVFGAKPGTKESGIPGKSVGYMPQEFSLYPDFSIQEMIFYFGTLYGMSKKEMEVSSRFIMKFLNLPNEDTRIGTLSGGQKRRVSLAVALIHSPKLLILDEPTVGVDPLLREAIWTHLRKLVSTRRTTIIITTHYIEEARQSNKIGLMRDGRLLMENNPEVLIQEYKAPSLEDVVLQICRKDSSTTSSEEGSHESYNGSGSHSCEFYGYLNYSFARLEQGKFCSKTYDPELEDIKWKQALKYSTTVAVSPEKTEDDTVLDSLVRIKALVVKNYHVMMRNLIFVVFLTFVPVMQMTILCLAIGNDPKPMNFGIVNLEMNGTVCKSFDTNNKTLGCDLNHLSCKYLDKIDHNIIPLIEYDSEEAARRDVKKGKLWGFMTFPVGYSQSMFIRASSSHLASRTELEGSQILFEMDMTNKEIGFSLKRMFSEAYSNYVADFLQSCGFDPVLGESPLKYLPPIYGSHNTDFREFVSPGSLLGAVFFFPLCSSSISYIRDKKLGTFERSLVAGVKTWEIMTAFFITEGCVLLMQVTLAFVNQIYFFGIICQGSIFLAISIAILMGLSGVSLGFLLGSFCNEEMESTLLALASFFPNILLSGILWPIEGMPLAMQYFSYMLPCTLATESIRSIISRGWGFTHFRVWPGFVNSIAWIVIYWTATICIHKISLAKK